MDSIQGAARLGGGKRVAITAGSRGIARISEILAAVVSRVRDYGGLPFLVPAMGSHGRATAEGQVALLAELGITEESVGAPIEATMEVVKLGQLPEGLPVYMDRVAAAADAIVAVNRTKPHTDYIGEIESGVAKIIAIGLGKQKGADAIHSYGVHALRDWMPRAARLAIQEAPVAMGLAIVENAYHEVADIVPLLPEEIGGPKEAECLARGRSLMARLPFDEIDVVIVEEMGKNLIGTGIDPHVLGRIRVSGISDPPRPIVHMVAVLGLTPETHGNAIGIGLADVTTRRLVEQTDFEAMYTNALTAGMAGTKRAFLPIVAPTDYAAIQAALHCCGRPDPENARIVRIKNTLMLGEIDVSESLLAEVAGQGSLSLVGAPFSLRFDGEKRLAPFEKMSSPWSKQSDTVST